VGDFDERLGLGARYAASEDSDYAIRALGRGAGRYDPGLVVEHPYKAHRPAQYYVGNVAVLAKHAGRGAGFAALLHRLGVGAVWALRGRLPPRALARALRAAGEMAVSRR
jgi:hypothetical protein